MLGTVSNPLIDLDHRYPGLIPDSRLRNMRGRDTGKPCSFQSWNSGSITDSIVITVLSEKRG